MWAGGGDGSWSHDIYVSEQDVTCELVSNAASIRRLPLVQDSTQQGSFGISLETFKEDPSGMGSSCQQKADSQMRWLSTPSIPRPLRYSQVFHLTPCPSAAKRHGAAKWQQRGAMMGEAPGPSPATPSLTAAEVPSLPTEAPFLPASVQLWRKTCHETWRQPRAVSGMYAKASKCLYPRKWIWSFLFFFLLNATFHTLQISF